MRFADRVKNTRPREDGTPAVEDENLRKHFVNPELGLLNEPATILDEHDRIMAWHLPDILHPSMVVSSLVCMLSPITYKCSLSARNLPMGRLSESENPCSIPYPRVQLTQTQSLGATAGLSLAHFLVQEC